MEKNKKMMKKLVSLMCCLLPVGAGAVVVGPESGQNSISTTDAAWLDAVGAGQTITINSANVNGINAVGGSGAGGAVVPAGFSIDNNMIVGSATDQGSEFGSLYVLNTVQNPFTVISTGDVSVGAILQVLDGKTLGFKTSDSSPNAFNLTVGSGQVNEGIKVGDETQSATLSLAGIDALMVNGSVLSYGDFTANANSIDVSGLINSNAGNMTMAAVNDAAMGGLVAVGDGATSVSAGGDITVDGPLQNTQGSMIVSAGGDIDVSGVVENKSTGNMTLTGGVLTVGKTMTNESNTATLTMNVDGWTINGGSDTSYSFVNGGNLYATVAGDTYMAYGMNLGTMQASNVFSLDTHTLTFGPNATTQTWFNAFSNHLNNFNVAVRKGDLSLSTILNGANTSGTMNANANMSILAQNISATTVRNDGDTLVIKAADLDSGYDVVAPAATNTIGNINIAGQVIGNAGTTTDIIASGVLTVDDTATNNNGSMTLNGNTVNLASVSNAGASANTTVSSLTASSGVVNISGDVTNSDGTTTIWAKDVNIDGVVTNNSGTMNVRGSDTAGGAVQIGSLVTTNGVTNLNAMAGSVSIDNVLTVGGGALNLGDSLRNLTVGNSVQIAGDVTASATGATSGADMNIAAAGTVPFVLTADTVLISGDVSVVDSTVARNIQFDAPIIKVSGDATVANLGALTLGKDATSYVRVVGELTANDGGTFETYANDLFVGSLSGNGKFAVHGANITANAGDIDIDGNLYFDAINDPTAPTAGMIVRDTTALTLKTTATGADVSVGAAFVGAGNTLTVDSADAITVGGVLSNNGTTALKAASGVQVVGQTTNAGDLNISGTQVEMADVSNTGSAVITATDGAVTLGNVSSSDSLTVDATTDIVAGAVSQTAGAMDLNAQSVSLQSLVVNGAVGTQANIDATTVAIARNANVSGDFTQGGTSGMLNVAATDFSAANLNVGGDFIAVAGTTAYDIDANATISGDVSVDSGATSVLNAGGVFSATDLTNAGTLTIAATRGIDLAAISNTAGVLTLDSGDGVLNFDTLALGAGNLVLDGAAMSMTGRINTGHMLYQNYAGALSDQDISIVADEYTMTTAGLQVSGINQQGKLVINTSDIDVGGSIVANDLRFVANPAGNWMNVDVAGHVSGDVDFIGLEKMNIDFNYVFNDGSSINAAILPYVDGGGLNATDINYWATVSLNDDQTLGQITNGTGDDVRALITVGGTFESDLNTLGTLTDGGQLGDAQIGINIFDIVDQGTAIWFLHAEDGVKDLATKIRNLNVSFCNADGSLCYNYLDSITVKNVNGTDTDINGADEDLPAYVSVRDVNEDGVSDSLYIVFDPRFGGPVEVFKIQPIVGREDNHTKGEYVSAGALDDMIAGQLANKKFYNSTPIEVIPLVFKGTNLSTMADELYNRMEEYVLNRDGGALARFSRLFQVREIEQIAGSVALNEHTSFRSFEDRMFDEFIWNRNRNLKKAWLDVDFGMFYQNIDDGKHTDGNRFSIAGGFDWQESNTLILGLTGRVSHTGSNSHDAMDLGYLPNQSIAGDVKIDVADTNIGLGGYMMQILGEKTRLYGNAFLDIHMLDVDRFQNYVGAIDGDGTAFSLITEWGLMHDILNQYVVGNLYARAGYNFGFNVKEKVEGDDYMRLKSDGYLILTPGYSLVAQKRIYPSAWFQIRPYASVGVEYDLMGAPDKAQYKFAVADNFTKYDVDIDPLWANIGGGIEFLSANGLQFGVDYRYQYNQDIQLHNIKVSGSYRF